MTEFNDDVISQLAAVRESGSCNMHDRVCVRQFAEQAGFEELESFLADADNAQYMDYLKEMGSRV